MKQMVIGISGSFSSGQDTLARYLRDEHDFVWISTSDMVREEAKRLYGSVERPDMHNAAKYLRETYGGGILVKRAMEIYKTIPKKSGIVLSGIRSTGELREVLNSGGQIIYTDADPDVRYKRMVARHRDLETRLTEEEFLEREKSEWYAGDADTDHNRRDIYAYASEHNTVLWNDNDLKMFFDRAKAILGLG